MDKFDQRSRGFIRKKSEVVFLGLGANRDHPDAAILQAARILEAHISEMTVSSLYRSTPLIDTDQPDFVNAVVSGVTSLAPIELLREIQLIEARLGRRRDPRRPKGPRSIDIDILLYGPGILDRPDLQIPHKEMTNRKFVLVPLLELNPYLREPETGIFYAHYADRLEKQGIYYFSLNNYSAILSWKG